MENEPDHENVEQNLCAKTAEEELNKSFNLEASLSKFSYIDLDKELEFKNDLIDDKEFDIPQVDTPPTLESILNETDDEDESFVLEDPTLLNIDTIDSHSYDTSSVASSDSGDRTNLKRKKKLPDSFSLHGSVMRHSLLKGISAQIVSAAFTDDPTLAICNDSGGSVFELTFKRVMGVRTCESRCLFSGSKGEVCCIEPLHSKPELKDHPITQFSLLAMASLTKMDPSSVPLLAWHFVAVHNYVNPMLAFCRGDVVHFLLVKRDESGAIHVTKQKHLHLYYDLINFTWINSRTVVLLDSVEKLHVVDRQTQEELETVEISEVQLVYNSSHFKSLATGGNVSQALRVDHLLKQDCLTEALALAWSFHEGKAKAVVGLSGDANKRKAVVADRMVEILFHYADRALKKCPDQGKIQVMEQHFQDMVPVIVDYCLLLQRKDLLFSQMYDKLSENSVAKGVFLECLEPYILSEKLVGITPQVMKDLIVHFQDKKLMENVESLIVHMDITSLDIQQLPGGGGGGARQVAWTWSGRTRAPGGCPEEEACGGSLDSEQPLLNTRGAVWRRRRSAAGHLDSERLYQNSGRLHGGGGGARQVVWTQSDRTRATGVCWEEEVCCLAGRAYPLGDIPEDLVPLVKNQVFEFLIRLHSAEASPEEEIYPYVRTLLHFDTREFLNVLALTFEDFKNDKQAVEYQQRIVDILLKVMVENSDFTPSQVGCLFTFLARQLAKPDNTLFVNRTLFDQVLLELLQAGGIVQFEESRLIRMAEKAEFYQICEFMYEREHQYDKIIDCYLRDPLREELVSLKPCKAAELVATHFSGQIEIVLKKLQNQVLLFKFLRSLLDPREGVHVNQELLQISPCITEQFIELLCQFNPNQVIETLQVLECYRLEETIQVVKLLSKTPELNLDQFHDKTPYTIMFGPDKCGEDYKLHYIFRHKNPKMGVYEEKHAKRPDADLKTYFTDKKTHLYTLILNPDNSFEILVDQSVVNSGNLLNDMTPAVNPSREIEDPEDRKPEDWDERPKIPDPDAVKPDDWDEDAPAKIPDEEATKPEGWLDDEPEYIPDPDAEKSEDWDEDMDGEWETPQIANPKCESASGCGVWQRPMIDNPNYKGKWKPPMIDNPNYQGIWKPRKIPNPDFFEDLEPFRMTPFSAIGLELWSMTSDIFFDNFIISGDRRVVDDWANDGWGLKKAADGAAKPGVVGQILEAAEERPWLWVVYILTVALPVFLVILFCCSGKKQSSAMEYKKTDAPQPDVKEEEEKEEEKDKGDEEEEGEEKLEEKQKSDAEEDGGTVSQEEEDRKPKAEEDEILNRSPRNRKPRRE
ncbi:Vacuolar protein sorting-associated protein 8-like protein [Sciurus carolinensis]|uniref:Calnexin n=1 Tax=Sciurus carolinensis TaxID=30640 RepID=A0AA41N0G0_SCICA|nr:Vacuolar protein sorting-associated protein 8-like protein [Sciurus carolinensis]